MLPNRVSNPGPLTYESGALPIALRGPEYQNIKHRYNARCLRIDLYKLVGWLFWV